MEAEFQKLVATDVIGGGMVLNLALRLKIHRHLRPAPFANALAQTSNNSNDVSTLGQSADGS